MACEAAILATACVATISPRLTPKQIIGQRAQGGTDVGGCRVADATTVLVVVGVAGVVHTGLDVPVVAAKSEEVHGRGPVCATAGEQMDEPLLFVAVAQIEAVTADCDQLRREWEVERFGGQAAALDFTSFDATTHFLDRACLRGKRPPAAAGVVPGLAGRAGCP